MIYDPSRRAQDLRHRILESMTDEEREEYEMQLADSESPPGDVKPSTQSEEDSGPVVSKPDEPLGRDRTTQNISH